LRAHPPTSSVAAMTPKGIEGRKARDAITRQLISARSLAICELQTRVQ
jgi:hypothetical protein